MTDQPNRWGLAPSVAAAFAASACCTVPFALAAVGVGGALASSLTALEPARPYLTGLAVAALAWALWTAVRADRRAVQASGPDCACEPRRTRWVPLLGGAALVAFLLAAPLLLPSAGAAGPRSSVAGMADGERLAVVRVSGMTCAACATGLQASLGRVEGVRAVTVTMRPPEARFRYDESRTTPRALVAAVEAQGYEAEVVPAR